jgi:hypothetical protein
VHRFAPIGAPANIQREPGHRKAYTKPPSHGVARRAPSQSIRAVVVLRLSGICQNESPITAAVIGRFMVSRQRHVWISSSRGSLVQDNYTRRRSLPQRQGCRFTTRGTRSGEPWADPACSQRPAGTPAYWRPRRSLETLAESGDWIGPTAEGPPGSCCCTTPGRRR